MHDELTREDIKKMQEELDYRRLELMPGLIEEVKRTRAFGDLSENFEYKAAKQAQNKNRSRIRYLEGMIKSARIIDDSSAADEVGLFDKVEIYMPDEDDTETIQVVTTVRCEPQEGADKQGVAFGRQVLGKKVGDEFIVQVSDSYSYKARIRSITKMKDDGFRPADGILTAAFKCRPDIMKRPLFQENRRGGPSLLLCSSSQQGSQPSALRGQGSQSAVVCGRQGTFGAGLGIAGHAGGCAVEAGLHIDLYADLQRQAGGVVYLLGQRDVACEGEHLHTLDGRVIARMLGVPQHLSRILADEAAVVNYSQPGRQGSRKTGVEIPAAAEIDALRLHESLELFVEQGKGDNGLSPVVVVGALYTGHHVPGAGGIIRIPGAERTVRVLAVAEADAAVGGLGAGHGLGP